MNSKRTATISWRFASGGFVALSVSAALVAVSINFPAWLSAPTEAEQVQDEPVTSLAADPVKPGGKISIASSGPATTHANLPPARELLAEANRILGLFDQGHMHEIYALFTDESKAQIPESVFIEQANEVLKQLGPIKPDGWDDADWISTLLNGRSHGRKVLLWKLHPDTHQFYVGSVRFGELSESSEDLLLDVSSKPIRLSMISEFKDQPPAASFWLPRTCPHAGEDPLRQCKKPEVP